MENKYVINESTLARIADAIRIQENSGGSISANDFAKRIEAIEPTVEDYMRISDFIPHLKTVNELNYTAAEVNKCEQLYQFYLEMEEK